MTTLPPSELIERAFAANDPAASPPYAVVQTPDGVTWFAIRDYGSRQEGLQIGTGCFLTFQSMNANGDWGDWVVFNGGLISREPGAEQGCLDLLCTVDGNFGSGFSVRGDMTKFGGPDAGLLPIVDRRMNIGSLWQRIKTIFCTQLAIETTGKQIMINGVWQWVDCIPVETQQGVMWIPAFHANA